MILGIILIVIGIIGFILGVTLEFCTRNNEVPYIFLCLLIFIIPMGIALITHDKNPKPTKQDVIDGKAYYQETQVIIDNDTVKTYEIVWKQKN